MASKKITDKDVRFIALGDDRRISGRGATEATAVSDLKRNYGYGFNDSDVIVYRVNGIGLAKVSRIWTDLK